MIYALRKLIAFVFLGGIFWFVYYDPAEIGTPWFMHVLGVLTAIFGLFWLIVPLVVVKMRIASRRRQNRERYDKWLQKSDGGEKINPLRNEPYLRLSDGENVYFHEKGTAYFESGAGFDAISVPGKPGDVAFPGKHRLTRKIQRTHFYLTNRRIFLAGKEIRFEKPLGDLESRAIEPGGILFAFSGKGSSIHIAMTFRNPLVAGHILGRASMAEIANH